MREASESGRTVRFGVFEVDRATGELRKAGVRIKLQEQPFQLLAMLLERPGEVVTREELRQRLWPQDAYVDFDRSLNTAASRLREALGDSSHSPRFIETLPRRGCRFVGPVEGIGEAPATPLAPRASPRRATPLLAGVVVAAVAVAVAGWFWFSRSGTSEPEKPMTPLPLTTYPGWELHPSFSPDGNEVAFTWNGEDENNFDIYRKLVGPGPPLRLTSHPARDLWPAWSPDGRYIAFLRYIGDGKAGIFLIPSLGGVEQQLVEAVLTREPAFCRLAWSLDGEWLVISGRAAGEERGSLFGLSVATREKRRVTFPPEGSWGDHGASYSPDGRSLVFVRSPNWSTRSARVLPDRDAGRGGELRRPAQPSCFSRAFVIVWPPGRSRGFSRQTGPKGRFQGLCMRCFLLVCVILWASLVCGSLIAQTGTGSILGTVNDSSGAVIPASKVTVEHLETSRRYETETNEVGYYLFPALLTGNYSISVQAAGMEAWTGSLVLEVGQAAVVDAALKVGTTAVEITIAGDVTPLVTVTSATLSNVVERARIDQLPLSGRFVQGLVQRTTPGLEGNDYAPRVYGLRSTALEFLQDGSSITQRNTGSIMGRPPGLDTIEEFRVETNNSSAKMNRPATVMLSTRSGANKLHGAAFETARNNALGVARRRQDFYDKPPHLVRNEFGVSLGGPVYIPRLYKGMNRTFFFFAYEGYRNMSAATTSTTMPTMAMRQGNFSGLVDSAGRFITLYDPWTTDSRTWARQPFPNNTIPVSRQSPLAKYLYSVTPAPTMPEVNPLVRANYFGPGIDNRRDHTETVRIDHRLSDRDQIFGRFTHGNRWSGARSGAGGSPTLLDEAANITFRPMQDDSGVFSWTRTISPTFFSETIVSGSREQGAWCVGTDWINHSDRLGLPNPFNVTGFPNLTSTGFDMVYSYADNKRTDITLIIIADQNFTKLHGRHEFQFGGRFRYEKLDVLPDQQYMQGAHNFSSQATALYDSRSGSTYAALPRTGHDSANLFLGVIGQYQAWFMRGWYHLRAREFSGYFQDNFKITSKLTLNLGVRWEFYPAMRETNNVLAGFDPRTKSIINGADVEKMTRLGYSNRAIVSQYTKMGVQFSTPREAGLPDALIHSNLWDFGPRAGFAYRMGSGKGATVIRGGYSLYAFPMPLRTFYTRMRQNPPTTARYSINMNSAAQSPDGLPNYGLRTVPTVIAGVNSRDVLDFVLDPDKTGGVSRGSFLTAFFDPRQPTSRAHEWNFTLEREIAANTVARAGYVGTHGSRLDQFYIFNQQPNNYVWFTTAGLPLPTGEYANVARRGFDQTVFGDIEQYRKTGWSNCSAVQLELRRRYSRGYGFQVFYVMSNAFRAGGNAPSDDSVPELNVFLPGAVPADYDARNSFLNYRRDSELPKHRMRWNWIVDLPFGNGRRLARNAGGFLDRVVGGWQLAGFGNITSRYWSLPVTNWGPIGSVELYGKRYPVEDCRSGRCVQGCLWYNGYIPANRINSYDAQGRPNGVMGVPAGYKPAHQPVIPMPADSGNPSDPNYAYLGSNTVWVPLKNGTLQRTTLDTNLHPWRNQLMPGPRSWGLDASLFKTTRINERFNLRFNADFFNVLNMPGLVLPDSSTGILSLQNSGQSARQLQLTLRLTW